MKKIKVYIKDKNTLVLDENGFRGDYIDLTELTNYDATTLEQAILDGKDQVYQKKLAEVQNQHQLEIDKMKASMLLELTQKYEEQILTLKKELDLLQKDKTTELKIQEEKFNAIKLSLESNYKHELEQLTLEGKHLKEQWKEKEEKNKLEIQQQFFEEIKQLKMNIERLQNESKLKHMQYEQEKRVAILEKEHEIDTQKSSFELEKLEIEKKHQEELQNKNMEIDVLKRQKASLNVKQTGEDLEIWCDHTVKEQMQNGFLNCIWKKDNIVIRDEKEQKGSKADYIFEIYASEQHLDAELLTNLCLEMKDENPESTNRQTNEHYYKALDTNRRKKNCKYALLVSNLEMDKPNDIPIYKVREYEDMYVVRPGYLMTFLHMITSLTMRFQQLVLKNMEKELAIKDKLSLLEEFDMLKKRYLDKPLEALASDIEDISKQNAIISTASRKIEEKIMHITTQYIQNITDKLARFERNLH